MELTRPLFMENEAWYDYDDDGEIVLTKDAPKEAVESYNEFKKELQKQEENDLKFLKSTLNK